MIYIKSQKTIIYKKNCNLLPILSICWKVIIIINIIITQVVLTNILINAKMRILIQINQILWSILIFQRTLLKLPNLNQTCLTNYSFWNQHDFYTILKNNEKRSYTKPNCLFFTNQPLLKTNVHIYISIASFSIAQAKFDVKCKIYLQKTAITTFISTNEFKTKPNSNEFTLEIYTGEQYISLTCYQIKNPKTDALESYIMYHWAIPTYTCKFSL